MRVDNDLAFRYNESRSRELVMVCHASEGIGDVPEVAGVDPSLMHLALDVLINDERDMELPE